MSLFGGAIRDIEGIRTYLKEVERQLSDFSPGIEGESRLGLLYRLRDMLLSQQAYLTAMIDYVERGGKSRGSALYIEETEKNLWKKQFFEVFKEDLVKGGDTLREWQQKTPLLTGEGMALSGQVQEVLRRDGKYVCTWRDVRPIPKEEEFFENVWRAYRENGNID